MNFTNFYLTIVVATLCVAGSTPQPSTAKQVNVNDKVSLKIHKPDPSTFAELSKVVGGWNGSAYSQKRLEKLKNIKDKVKEVKDDKTKSKSDKAKAAAKSAKKEIIGKINGPRIIYLRPIKRKHTQWSRVAARKGKFTYGALRIQDKCTKPIAADVIKKGLTTAIKEGSYFSINCDGDLLAVKKLISTKPEAKTENKQNGKK